MMITVSEETMKELLDRSWLCDVYGRRMAEIKKVMAGEGKTDLEIYTAVMEVLK